MDVIVPILVGAVAIIVGVGVGYFVRKNISEANLTSKWDDSDCVKSPYRGLTYKSA